MRKRLAAMLLCCAFVLCGCGIQWNTEQLREQFDAYFDLDDSQLEELEPASYIGIVVKRLSDEYFPLMKAGAEHRADELGVSVAVVSSDTEQDYAQQAEIVDILTAQGVDALAFALPQSRALTRSLESAQKAGIPLIALDTQSDFLGCACYIGSDNYDAGQKLGKFAAEQIGTGGTAVILQGQSNDRAHMDRTTGIFCTLNEADITVLEIETCDSDYELARDAARSALSQYPDLDLFCCTSDEMAMGALDAVSAADVQTAVIGFDGILAAAGLVESGTMLGTISQDAYHMGELAVDIACRLINGESVESPIICDTAVITKENASDYIRSVRAKLYPEENDE
ncbi:MAG: sugar ABC transporter substrate-binding protein [Butyricicoccaceae bacterium]